MAHQALDLHHLGEQLRNGNPQSNNLLTKQYC